MKPGRELDSLVAEKVMNYICPEVENCTENHYPHYSTDITSAWKVVEKLQHYDWSLYVAADECLIEVYGSDGDTEDTFEACGVTPCHAICLAALKVVETV